MVNHVVDLTDNSAKNIAISGGKGANLARLHGISGIPVPDGFVITAQSYSDLVLSKLEIGDLLSQLVDITHENTEAISQLSGQIREKIERLSFSASFESEIINAL